MYPHSASLGIPGADDAEMLLHGSAAGDWFCCCWRSIVLLLAIDGSAAWFCCRWRLIVLLLLATGSAAGDWMYVWMKYKFKYMDNYIIYCTSINLDDGSTDVR